MKLLVTGATGYIGGRLIPILLGQGHQVRVLVRDPDRIRGRSWTGKVEVFTGDLLDPTSLGAALEGIEVVYYLVHSMLAGAEFAELDRVAARNFVSKAGHVQHVIYLGGLVPSDGAASDHLSSRAEVGAILRANLPTTEFRAGPIIGSGSASFEMLRYLTERLPVMVASRWIRNEIQPLAVRDILSYLEGALRVGPSGIIEVGTDRITFRQMLVQYAEIRGLKRLILSPPFFEPGFAIAARWVGLITPIPNSMAIPIIEGMSHALLADTTRAQELFPEIKPISYRKAVELALNKIMTGRIETRWSNALWASQVPYLHKDVEGMISEVRSLKVAASPEELFTVFSGLGGDRGWLTWNWAWAIRGFIDSWLGGPGLRRGRRDPNEILPGESIDFWRVEAVMPAKLLRLRAEMKVPGKAWIQWEALSEPAGTRLLQTAYFAPKGLAGFVYWYALYPIHRVIFSDLARAIARAAEDKHH